MVDQSRGTGTARASILGNELTTCHSAECNCHPWCTMDVLGRFSPVPETGRTFSRTDHSPHGVQHVHIFFGNNMVVVILVFGSRFPSQLEPT
eukprot:4145214-Pleurochrysis_carterae.AAC.2